MTSTERRRETPYESHELHTLATLAVSQSYLAVVAGLLLQFVTELGLRQDPGFADDTIQDAAIRYVGGAAAGLLCYGLSYVIPKRVRRPFLEATLLMLAVSALSGMIATATFAILTNLCSISVSMRCFFRAASGVAGLATIAIGSASMNSDANSSVRFAGATSRHRYLGVGSSASIPLFLKPIATMAQRPSYGPYGTCRIDRSPRFTLYRQ